jgi:hypothetical protein
MTQLRPFVCIAALAMVAASPATLGATLYADAQLTASCIGKYDSTARACRNGNATAYATIEQAVDAAQPGDTVLIRGGRYDERIEPPRSGMADAPIVIKRYRDEKTVLTGIRSVPIAVIGRSHIVIEGLAVEHVTGWGELRDSSHIHVVGNRFAHATSRGTTGGLKLVRTRYSKIVGNVFDDGNDSVTIQESDRNLLQDNTFNKARHSLLSVRCGNFNVIRGNSFRNADQKSAEIYDCEGVSDAPYRLNATRHNLFEGNRFIYTRATPDVFRYNAIQYIGQRGIVRRNIFHDNQGGGLNLQIYKDEALYNHGHRVYNNTFFNNRCYGISASPARMPDRYFDNRVVNNLLVGNVGCKSERAQIAIGNPSAVILENNAILDSSPFVDDASRDLRLKAGSKPIDSGVFVTQAKGTGSGHVLAVVDPTYFYDGYGIPGEKGDLIQIAGRAKTARIVSIDYNARTLTLSEPLSWKNNDGVHLAYSGSRPDVGAFEFSP